MDNTPSELINESLLSTIDDFMETFETVNPKIDTKYWIVILEDTLKNLLVRREYTELIEIYFDLRDELYWIVDHVFLKNDTRVNEEMCKIGHSVLSEVMKPLGISNIREGIVVFLEDGIYNLTSNFFIQLEEYLE